MLKQICETIHANEIWRKYLFIEGATYMYQYKDYFELYDRIMQFNKNKMEPVHRWYPFVEGYSKEFIHSIVQEQNGTVECCLEPFSGSGTTAVELQKLGIKCISFEVNPFMYLLAKVKLESGYEEKELKRYFSQIKRSRCKFKNVELSKEFITLYENDKVKKWNYDLETGIAIEKLKMAIIHIDNEVYRDFFTIVLASILLEVSNLYRNGKCLSYKEGWEDQKKPEETVFSIFDTRFHDVFLADIISEKRENKVNNKKYLYNEDSRMGIKTRVADNSVSLVITSPPYLNSRDYTDTYMLELKTLGFAKTLDQISELRQSTIRSHVQIHWTDKTTLNIPRLNLLLQELKNAAKSNTAWNSSIIDMVRLYFVDINTILEQLYCKLKIGGMIYFNVSNSAYFNVLVDTIEIVCDIAENIGFTVKEIRKARLLNPSPQQKKAIDKLLEAVIVIQR